MISVFSNLIEKLENNNILSSAEEGEFIKQMKTCKNAVKVIHAWGVLASNKTHKALLLRLYPDLFQIVLSIIQNIQKEKFSLEETGYHLMEELKEMNGGTGVNTKQYKNIDWNDYC